MDIQSTSVLTASQAQQVATLAAEVAAADGVFPLNEAALLALDQAEADHLLAWIDDQLVGYGQLDEAGAAQLLITPNWRRQGLGAALLAELRQRAPTGAIWSFGDLEPARCFAETQRLALVRTLLVLQVATADLARRPAPDSPTISISAFDEAELAKLVALNQRAFRDHPEQGRWTISQWRARLAAPGFSPADLLCAHDPAGHLLGFVWTKLDQGDGEIAVIGVDPAHQRGGLGRRLLERGLADLRARGAALIRLWVEQDNHQALNLYERVGFSVVRRDRQYGMLEANNCHRKTP